MLLIKSLKCSLRGQKKIGPLPDWSQGMLRSFIILPPRSNSTNKFKLACFKRSDGGGLTSGIGELTFIC